MRRVILIVTGVVVAVVLILGCVVGMFDRTPPAADRNPTTAPTQPVPATEVTAEPSPDASPSPPERLNPSAAKVRVSKYETKMFDSKLIIRVPRSWTKLRSNTVVDWRYADRSNCSKRTKAANCPSIRFSSLTDTSSPDLLEEWMTAIPCLYGVDESQRPDPVSYLLGDRYVNFYALTCPDDTHPTHFGWHFDEEDVLVTTHAGKKGVVTPEIVEQVLAAAKWD